MRRLRLAQEVDGFTEAELREIGEKLWKNIEDLRRGNWTGAPASFGKRVERLK